MRQIPKLHYFKTEKEKEPYIIKTMQIATDIDVAINKIYGNDNLKVGQDFEYKEIPFAYFKYKNKIYPIYADNPGQQNYIKLNGKDYGAGAYTDYPYDIEYFIYEIDNYYKKENKKNGKR